MLPYAALDRVVQLVESDLPFRLEHHVVGDPDLLAAGLVVTPLLREVQPHVDAAAATLKGEVETDANLTVVDAAERPRVLTLHANGVNALLRKARVVLDQCFWPAERSNRIGLLTSARERGPIRARSCRDGVSPSPLSGPDGVLLPEASLR